MKREDLEKTIHFELATKFGGFNLWRNPSTIEFCPYARRVMLGVLGVLGLIILGVIVGVIILDAPAVLLMTLFTGEFNPGYFQIINLSDKGNSPIYLEFTFSVVAWGIGICFALLVYVIVPAFEKIKDQYIIYRYGIAGHEPQKEPTFLGMWWDVVHKKICPVIKLED